MNDSLIERMAATAANVRAMSERLQDYQNALENACLIYGVPFERDQPEKTLAKITEAAEDRARREAYEDNP